MKIFWFSIAFFVVSLLIALIVFLGGSNVVSSKNVLISVSGPTTIEAGSEVTLQILIRNRNDVALEFTDLVLVFPEGTRGADKEELQRMRVSLDTIPAGETTTKTISAIFFGQAGSSKDLAITLEYRVEGSNAIFVAENVHQITITSSPLDLVVDTLQETSSGQALPLVLTIRSNSEEVLRDLLLSVEYPFGYSFTSATPRPSAGNSVWDIGDLPPGGERTITIQGVLSGQDGEEKVFRVESGSASAEGGVGVVYNSWLTSISIGRPFLGLQFRLNGATLEEYSVEGNKVLRGEIEWINNTPTKITQAEIEAKLTGDVLNKASVDVRQGIFRSVDNTLLWTGDTKSELQEIEPGERGVVSFEFASRSLFPDGNTIFKSPTIHLVVNARGERLGETGVLREVDSTVERDIKIISAVSLSARAVYFTGPFANTGGIPPRVDRETTYTIVWSVVNSSNNVAGAEISATLPTSVRWLGVTTPSSETVSYDSRTRKVLWNLGVIREGSGITGDPREVSFQVGLLPSLSDLGQTLTLLGETTFTGSDEFAEKVIQIISRPLTTELFNDPQYVRGQEKVIQ